MKKILFVANQYFPHVVGGAELSLQSLTEEVNRLGLDTAVVSLSPTSNDTQDEVNGIRVFRIAVRNVYAPFGPKPSRVKKLFWHLRDIHNREMAHLVGRILDIERPDTVSTHNLGGFSVAVWGEARVRGIRIIHMIHDYYLLCPRTTMFRDDRNCVPQCFSCYALSGPKRAASSMVDVVIGVSRFVLDAHLTKGYFPNAKSTVIYNSRHEELRVEHAKPYEQAAALKIGYIGRVEHAKGIETLLNAVADLPADRWFLSVAGRAPDPAYLVDLQRKYPFPQVSYMGFVRPETFYRSLDVLVVPSLWNEPFGVVVYEAMGFGIPVIGSRTGGIPEIIDRGGIGWLFEPGNVEQLNTLLRAALESRKSLWEMRGACLARRAAFTPGRQAAEFLAV